MKKFLLIAVLIVCVSGTAVFAFESGDLKTYPSCTQAGDIIANFGVGFYIPWEKNVQVYIPKIRLTGDLNLPLGAEKLPFFAGLYVGYSGYKNDFVFLHQIPIAARFGYHFNLGVDKLDTYALVSAGYQIHFGKNISSEMKRGFLLLGINAGGRYFVTEKFGFWAEASLGSIFSLDLGLSFKF